MNNEKIWLGNILLKDKYKLTSKDKLVATYLIYAPHDGNFFKQPQNFPSLAHAISYYSGLAVRTVQKSLGRLVAVGAITFVTNIHFILEDSDATD
mgnify:CR=1 FL=1